MRQPNWDQSLCGGALPSLRQEVSLGILECWDFSLCECGGRRNILFLYSIFFFKRSNMMGEGFVKVEIFGIIRLQVFLQEGQPYFRKLCCGKKTIQMEPHGPLWRPCRLISITLPLPVIVTGFH